jgi:phosphatidylglycerol:prolipoprotein diacylglycerol transferase
MAALTIMYSSIDISGNIISTYNLFLTIALIVTVLIIEKQFIKYSVDNKLREKIRLLNAIVILSGLFGSALFEMIFQQKDLSINNLFTTGLTFYGGLILSVIVIVLYSLISKIKIYYLFNFYALPLTIGHAIGRLGCFFAGCCFGSPTNCLIGVRFPIDSVPYLHYHEIIKIHPTQLYESIGLLIIFLILRLVNLNKRFAIYLLSYSALRFVIEYFRSDSRGSIMDLTIFSPAQLISLILFIFGLIIMKKNYAS